MTNLSSKIAQLYQVLGDRLMGDPSPASDAEIQRALDYAADTERFDPDFLPWPKLAAASATAPEPAWQWWWSRDEETYSGPFATRDEAIEDARDEGQDSIYVAEAHKGRIDLADYFGRNGITDYVDDLEQGVFTDHQNEDGEALTEHITTAQWDALAKRIQPIVAEWQKAEGIVITPWSFSGIRNGEWVDTAATPEAPGEAEKPA